MRRQRIAGIAAAALVVAGTAVYVAGRQASDSARRGEGRAVTRLAESPPAVQPPVQKMDLDDFQAAFNTAHKETRLLVTLSPT